MPMKMWHDGYPWSYETSQRRMAVDVFVGQTGVVKVVMRDAGGRVTDDYDVLGGVQYTTTHPDSASVVDDDAEPRDARIEFAAVTPPDEEAFIEVRFDGRVGPEENLITLRSQGLVVLDPPPGEAVGGEVEIVLDMVPPPE